MKSFYNLNILLVDDEKEILDVLEEMLKVSIKSKIFKATNATEALNIMKRREIHLTILDIIMPGMNGLDLLKEINIKYPHTINFILSGYTDSSFLIKAIENHAYDFIEKPLNCDLLINRVRKGLNEVYHRYLLNAAVKEFLNTNLENFDFNSFNHKSVYEKNKILEQGFALISMKELKRVIGG